MMRLVSLLIIRLILFFPFFVSLWNEQTNTNIWVYSDDAEGYCLNNDDCDDNDDDDDDDEGEEETPWKEWTANEFWYHLDCDRIFSEGVRPIHNESTWMLLRGIYHGIVGPEESSIAPITYENGFKYKVVVRQNEKGRSVFAEEDIPEGELIWYTRNTARFSTGDAYRKFLISVDNELACDIIQWAYVQQSSNNGNKNNNNNKEQLYVSVDLDPGILINSGENIYKSDGITKRKKKKDVQNMGCHEEKAKALEGGCNENYFALRNIEKGEELLVDYGDFAIQDGWEHFGL